MAPVFSLLDHLAAIGALYALHERDVAVNHLHALGWTPKNDCVFVLQLQEADRSVGGIIAPDETRKPPSKGVVLAIGAGLWDAELRQLIEVECAPGDLVTFGEYSGETFDIEGVELLIVRNVEIKARKPAGTFTLTEHHLDEGGLHERRVYHETHIRCEHCPKPVSEVIEEERARLRAAHKAALAGDPADALALALDQAVSGTVPLTHDELMAGGDEVTSKAAIAEERRRLVQERDGTFDDDILF